MTFKGQGLLNR